MRLQPAPAILCMAAIVLASGWAAGAGTPVTGAPLAARAVATRTALATVRKDASVRWAERTTRWCAQAARRAGFPIACPIGLPHNAYLFWANGFGGSECGPARVAMRMRRWTWVGARFSVGGASRQVILTSVPYHVSPRAFVYSVGGVRPYRTSHVTIAATTTVRGYPAEYVHPSKLQGAEGSFLGRTVLMWFQRGRTYAIGVIDSRVQPRKVEAAEARRLVLVGRL